MIQAGGNAYTTAAIVGALAGLTNTVDPNGKLQIPQPWLAGVHNYPMTLEKLEQLAYAFEQRDASLMPKVNMFVQMIKNVLFFVVALIHGFRRMLPPY